MKFGHLEGVQNNPVLWGRNLPLTKWDDPLGTSYKCGYNSMYSASQLTISKATYTGCNSILL